MSNVVIDYLRSFLSLSDEEEKELSSILHYRKMNKNQLLISVGEVCDKIMFITKGAVRIFNYDTNGNEVTYQFFFENQPLTDPISFFEQKPSEFSADTMETTEFYWINYGEFNALIKKFPGLEKAVFSILVSQLPKEKEALKYQREPSAQKKYEGLMQTHPEIITRIPLKYIASYLGIALETLSRVRGKI